ncbi:class I SAM-dependent methyltransferase, partial [PVC group bacterium]|nr:class I SAM-dependent methyltransferase [PVC group bacterium]
MGARGGLCVHLGVQDGALAVKLSDGGRLLVHGLGANRDAVERARKTIAAARLEGAVSVELGSFDPLPYADDLVSLIVVDDLPRLLKQGLRSEEVIRVLRPNGVAWLGQRAGRGRAPLTAKALQTMLTQAGFGELEIVEDHGVWAKYVRARPESMDEWTHCRYNSSGNPVSKENIGVPSSVRWAAGPNWPTGHRKTSVPSVVVSEKHLVYLFEDEVRTAEGPKRELTLNARDAYNGLILWKRAGIPRSFLV